MTIVLFPNISKRKSSSHVKEIGDSVKKLASATKKTLVRHNAFLLAASEDNNYDLNKFYEQAKREMESDDDDDDSNNQAEVVDNEHVFFKCNFYSWIYKIQYLTP